VYEMTGQLDLAIACQLEGFRIYPADNVTIPHLILSRLYSKLSDGKKALEHVNLASIDLEDRSYPYFYIQRAHALILMNRLEEAENDLATAYSHVLRRDIEYYLGNYYHICGFYEQAKGNLLNALDFLERAFEIDERLHRFFWGIDTLFSLADVELSIKLLSRDRHEAYPSGPWTTKLETQLRVHNLPGLLMRFALLKADFYQKVEQYLDARQVLSEAAELSDSDGVRSFRLKIAEKLRELDHLIEKSSL
jgi:tetratricopeptide (TPR) repeat protein